MPTLRVLSEVRWFYPRPVTTLAVMAVAACTSLVVRALLPPPSRPPGVLPVVLASVGAYVAVRLGSHTAWTKRFKHEVVDWFGGDVDDAPTYLVAAIGSGGVLGLLQIVRRTAGRSCERPYRA